MADILYLEDISFGFGEKPLFRDFSLTLGEENPTVILGPSGCGKTTLLRLMAGLLEPQSGRVVSPAETGVSFVFQEPRLLPWLTVWENLLLPVKNAVPIKDAEARARTILEAVSLAEKAQAYPSELSGGQRQRASIARAFIYPSRLMVMDEPFQSLDIPLRIELMELTLKLLEKEPRLLIAVTHDPREAIFLGRRILVLGPPGEGVVFDEPNPSGRVYASPETSGLESRLIRALGGGR
ncbi:MAG: ABC transporter ATP-binding protein [Spirochaetaceae bacterium]|jgi:NitT/TauT family transport system ATP-binding protein|nr:ABC transporter ATP-binding protein [Spirochaetaceae bacterium]